MRSNHIEMNGGAGNDNHYSDARRATHAHPTPVRVPGARGAAHTLNAQDIHSIVERWHAPFLGGYVVSTAPVDVAEVELACLAGQFVQAVA